MSAAIYMAHRHAMQGTTHSSHLMLDVLEVNNTPTLMGDMVILNQHSVPLYAIHQQTTAQAKNTSLV